MAPFLEFRDVSFARGARAIFERLSLSITAGERVALLGPNGVGKSTLLAMIAGLLRPGSGTIVLNGVDVRHWNRRDLSRTVALVPQTLEVPFSFRVEEIVAQGRVPHLGRFGSLSARDLDVVERAMEAVDVLQLRNRVYQELSGGERQRVKIAIAMAQEPTLMLLDEPTQHLDIGRQIEIVGLLRRLNERGITVLAAVHDLTIARDNFERGILLTSEPACISGSVTELLTPELLARAFGVDGANFGGFSEPATALQHGAVHQGTTQPHRRVRGRHGRKINRDLR